MTVIVRRAQPGDEAAILRLIRALAEYEHALDSVKATEETLAGHLFCEHPSVFVHVAEIDGRVVGIAVWFLNFSTWTGKHGIYLEDLFVDLEVRGGGVARALFKGLAEEAQARDCPRVDWMGLTGTNWAKASTVVSAPGTTMSGSRGGWMEMHSVRCGTTELIEPA